MEKRISECNGGKEDGRVREDCHKDEAPAVAVEMVEPDHLYFHCISRQSDFL